MPASRRTVKISAGGGAMIFQLDAKRMGQAKFAKMSVTDSHEQEDI